MNADHIKTVFKDYISDPNDHFAVLINGSWGSGKTYFWEHELKPIAQTANKKTLYISLNGIANRDTLEQLIFIRMWKYLNEGDSKRKTQFAQVLANAASQLAKKKLDMNLPDLLRGLSLDSIMYSEYVMCFDDLERCRMPIPEILGFINDFVEHRKLKTLILSDESKVDHAQVGYAAIKEKVIGWTVNFHPDHGQLLPELIKKHAGNIPLHDFLKHHESFIRKLLEQFKEENLRIMDFCLAIIARLFPFLKGQHEPSIESALLCTITICIEYKRGNLTSDDEGDYKELKMLTLVQEIWSQPDKDGTDALPDIIKGAYPREFFSRYLKDVKQKFSLWEPIYNLILSGYLDENAIRSEVERRDPESIPESMVCYPLLINYKFRNLSNESFRYFVEKTRQYAEEGCYKIYDYLQIADFYFFFAKNGLIDLTTEEILDFVRKGLGKSAQRGETNDEIYGNLMHFKKDNPDSEKFKQEVSATHLSIIMERKRGAMARINQLIKEGDIDEIVKVFNEHRFDQDFLPATDMKELCEVVNVAPNKSLAQLAIIFEERYKSSNIGQLLSKDEPPLKALDKHLDQLLAVIPANDLRRFVITELSNAVKTGVTVVPASKRKPVIIKKHGKNTEPTADEEEI